MNYEALLISAAFIKFRIAKPPWTNVKSPYWKLSGDGSASGSQSFFSYSPLTNPNTANSSPRKIINILAKISQYLLRRSNKWFMNQTDSFITSVTAVNVPCPCVHIPSKPVVLIVVDIDPQGSIGLSKGSINSQGVEWGSMNGEGFNEKLLGSIGGMKPPIQNYC